MLFHVWDPIGVSDTPAARNEYDTYSADLTRRLLEDPSMTERDVADYLGGVCTDNMRLGVDVKLDEDLSRRIVHWYRDLRERHDRSAVRHAA